MKTSLIAVLAISAIFAACAPTPSATDAPTNGEVAAPAVDKLNVPVGRALPDGKKNRVISPYRPHNVIDTTGYKSGEIVGDPSTGSVDDKGKLVPNTAKLFRIP